MGKRKPGVPKEPKAAKRIKVTLGDSKADFQGRVNIQKGLRTTAPQAQKFNPTIKGTLDTWSADTDKAVVLYESILTKETELEQLYGSLGNQLLQVGLDREGFITAVESVCTNEADARSFGANQVSRLARLEASPPGTIRQIATHEIGTNRFRWASVPGAGAYMAETSADPPTATSWVPSYTGKSPFFNFTGTPGQKLWVRVASVGSAPSAWSTAVLFTLR